MELRAKWTERRGILLCLLSSSALAMLLFSRIVFAGEWLAGRDVFRVHVPLAKYWADRIRQGEFPEWYPYDALGQPFVGMIISGAFHPWRLLLLLGPPERVISLVSVVAYPLTALGTYVCARLLSLSGPASLFAALTYAFCGYMVSISNNFLYLIAAATIPWVLAAAEWFFRSPTALRALLAGATLASTVLVGDPQTFAICGAAVALLPFVRPSALTLRTKALHAVAVLGCALLVALPQVIPAMYVLQEARSNLNPADNAQVFSFHPLRLPELLLGPLYIDEEMGVTASLKIAGIFDPKMKTVWVDSSMIGAIAVLFAVAGAFIGLRHRLAKVCLALALLLLMMALGRHTPVYGWVYQLVPPWRAFRYPEKLLPYVSFFIAIGAAYAAHRATEDEVVRRRLFIAGLATAGVLFIAAAAQYFGDAWSGAMHSLGVGPRHGGLLGRRFLLFAATGALACGLAAATIRFARPAVALGVLCALQAALLTWPQLPVPFTVKLDLVDNPGGFIAQLLESGKVGLGKSRVHGAVIDYRIPSIAGFDSRELTALGMAATLEPDVPALYGIELGGYYMPAGSQRFVRGFVTERLFLDRLIPLYSIEYLSVGLPAMRGLKNRQEVVDAELREWDLFLLRHPNVLPRSYLARPKCIASEYAAVDELKALTFKPGVEALVECRGTSFSGAPTDDALGTAQIISYAPERVEIDLEAAGDGLVLVLNDAFFGGWTAELDGTPVEILPANLAVRAVPVPKGAHKVIFTYKERGLRGSLLASALGITALIAVGVWRRRAHKGIAAAGHTG